MADAKHRVPHRLFERKVGDSPSLAAPRGSGVPAEQVWERGIEIGPWTLTVRHGSIANAGEIDALTHALDIPLPEMPFVHNALVLSHEPSGFSYSFDAVNALRNVDGVAPGMRRDGMVLNPAAPSGAGLQVAHAENWCKTRYVGALTADPKHGCRTVPSARR